MSDDVTPTSPHPTAAPGRRRRGRRSGTRGAAALVLALLTALLLGAPASATSGDSAEPAWLRPAHLVPDLGAMDIRLSPFAGEGGTTPAEDRPLLETTAAYGAVGQYAAYPAGSYAVSVRAAGAPVSDPPLLSLTVDLEPGGAYTVAGLGSKTEPRLERLVDDLTPPAAGNANVRLLPASLAAPSVDVQAEGGPLLAQGAGLGRPTGYTAAPAGSWTITASGGGATGRTDLVLDPGTVYTLLVLDAEGGSLEVRPVVDSAGMATTPVGGAATGVAPEGGRGLALSGAAMLAGGALLVLTLVVRSRPGITSANASARRDAARTP